MMNVRCTHSFNYTIMYANPLFPPVFNIAVCAIATFQIPPLHAVSEYKTSLHYPDSMSLPLASHQMYTLQNSDPYI